MIKLVGMKRLLFLIVLLVLNLAVAGGYFAGVDPMLQSGQQQLNAVNAEIADLQTKIATIQQDIAFVKENMPKYEDMQKKGFFQAQDRFEIERTLENLRTTSGLAGFSFSISEVQDIPNADAEATDHKVVTSRITIDRIVAPIESSIYVFMQKISSVFPEFVRVQKLEVTRTGEVTEAALKQISEGGPVSFVNAVVVFDWITMVAKEAKTPDAAGQGGAPTGFRGR